MLSLKEGCEMKRLTVALLSGSLLIALSVLGAPGTAVTKLMGFATTTDTPTVSGDILNPAYFAHAAYVMQGVSDHDKVFALPLTGVPELAFLPTVTGRDPASVTWRLEISHPEGIGAEIADATLYIWGNNATWAGYGAVTLTATTGGKTVSVTIPVTVFRTDKTLINAEGKKDYFVPWSPQLDINRILSVEEHMRKYNKDEGQLDRSVGFSRWRVMEYRKDVDFLTIWANDSAAWSRDWTEESQFALVDLFLSELLRLGVNGIRFREIYYFAGLTGTDLFPLYDVGPFGLTRQPQETAYVVNEAHRLGLSVMLGNAYFPYVPNKAYELFNASPAPLTTFFANVAERDMQSLHDWLRLGVDIVDLGTQLETINGGPQTWQEAKYRDEVITQMAINARTVYPGPLYHAALAFGLFYPGGSQLQADFWWQFDILGSGVMALRVTPYATPTLQQLAEGWRKLIHDYHQPFQTRYNKPLLAYENGCLSVKGCVNWGGYGGDCAAYAASNPQSLDDIRLWYLSQDEAFKEMEGYFGPGWHFYAFSPDAVGSIRDRSTNPRLKVEDVIQKIFLGAPSTQLISIDGAFADWSDRYIIGSDPEGDSQGPNDLLRMSFVQDDSYLYFRVDYAAPPSGDLRIELDFDGDLKADLHLDLSDRYSPDGTWWGNSYTYTSEQHRMGIVDSMDHGASVELRVPKRFLQAFLRPDYVAVRFAHYDRFWDLGDQTQWFPLYGVPVAATPSVFELLDCGSLTSDPALALDGQRSVAGVYAGSGQFTPYLRTVPSELSLAPRGKYRVCFDYRIITTGKDGFEVLFYSPVGGSRNDWVVPLRVNGQEGQSGHSCLEAQLLGYSDYEIRWNVISTGKIVVDNVVVTDLATDTEIAREGFEAWR
jgi:hypothetical protein